MTARMDRLQCHFVQVMSPKLLAMFGCDVDTGCRWLGDNAMAGELHHANGHSRTFVDRPLRGCNAQSTGGATERGVRYQACCQLSGASKACCPRSYCCAPFVCCNPFAGPIPAEWGAVGSLPKLASL